MQRFRPRKTKKALQISGGSRLSSRKNEPDIISPACLQCPKDYKELESEIWNFYFDMLSANKTLSATDSAILDIFTRTYAEVLELETYLDENGKTYIAENGRKYAQPEVAIRNDARRELRGLLIQLGLSPASRGHVEKLKFSSDPLAGLKKLT